MKRVLWLAPVLLFLCATANAQTPNWELAGGYSYLSANFNDSGTKFHLNGGNASATQNINRWFGGRVEFNAFGGSVAGTNVSAQTVTYGPVFAYRKSSRFVPYVHGQAGLVHASTGYLGISNSAIRFAMAGGGGFDFKITDRAAIRFQGDYLMTRFLHLRQDNLLFSTGLVIHFGTK